MQVMPRVIDLFCGAGGLALGLTQTGFQIVYAADSWKAATDTYRARLGNHVENIELTEASVLPKADIIVGGPPCQGFSSAGQRRNGDARNSLVGTFARLIARQRPKMFVFENVEGFLTAEGGRRVIELLDPLIEAGYRLHLRKINAANYGVPQHRKRVIAIGALGFDPVFPEPTHYALGAPGTHRIGRHLAQTPTIAEALKGLPSSDVTPPGVPSWHYAAVPNDDDLARIRILEQGQTMKDLPQIMWHASYRRRSLRRVMDGTPTEKRGGAPAGLRRLVADAPSKAITSFARNEFVHPTEDRFLTLRECARIQTFPDEYQFRGSVADVALQIANAIPPTLAQALGRSLEQSFAMSRSQAPRRDGPALLSFVPTVAEGVSPVLATVCALVDERYSVQPPRDAEQRSLWA